MRFFRHNGEWETCGLRLADKGRRDATEKFREGSFFCVGQAERSKKSKTGISRTIITIPGSANRGNVSSITLTTHTHLLLVSKPLGTVNSQKVKTGGSGSMDSEAGGGERTVPFCFFGSCLWHALNPAIVVGKSKRMKYLVFFDRILLKSNIVLCILPPCPVVTCSLRRGHLFSRRYVFAFRRVRLPRFSCHASTHRANHEQYFFFHAPD
jgi:hypothetical protein